MKEIYYDRHYQNDINNHRYKRQLFKRDTEEIIGDWEPAVIRDPYEEYEYINFWLKPSDEYLREWVI